MINHAQMWGRARWKRVSVAGRTSAAVSAVMKVEPTLTVEALYEMVKADVRISLTTLKRVLRGMVENRQLRFEKGVVTWGAS